MNNFALPTFTPATDATHPAVGDADSNAGAPMAHAAPEDGGDEETKNQESANSAKLAETEQEQSAGTEEMLLGGVSARAVNAALPPGPDGGKADGPDQPTNRHERRAYPATHDGAPAPSRLPVAPPLANGPAHAGNTGEAVPETGEGGGQGIPPASRNLVLTSLSGFADVINQPNDPVIGSLEPGLLGKIIGVPGISKSTAVLHMGVATAGGRPFAGLDVPRPQRVLIYTPEDPDKEIARRLYAACRELGADEEIVDQNLQVASFRRGGPLLAKAVNGGQELSELGEELRDAIRDHRARLVIFDPLVEVHTAPESDNGEMHGVFSAFRDLARNNNCAILITHHVTKDAKGNLTMFNGRGAGSMAGAVRVMFGLEEISKKEADEVVLRHSGSTTRDFVTFSMLKANYEKVPGTSVTLRRVDNVVGAGRAPSLRALTG
ncbi:ATPase-like protein [Acidocella sp. MX-AZ02]|nr:ATPase-like protein [Acidocella sp. MX-AZ02]